MSRRAPPPGVIVVVGLVVGCGDVSVGEDAWEVVHEDLPGALLSVWGTGVEDVWAVGADSRDGLGPTVLRYDGGGWDRLDTGQDAGTLWWVFGFEGGPVYLGGDGGVILRHHDGVFDVMDTPGTQTVFGIWGAAPDDVWAVGGASEAAQGFAWRLRGDTWASEPSLPGDMVADAAVWKVFGTATDDAWLVGSKGVALHWDGTMLAPGDTGVGSSLFTVHAAGGRYAAVGGAATGIIVEDEGDGWHIVTPEPPPMGLAGVTLGENDAGIAVGLFGTLYTRDAAGWRPEESGLPVRENLHGTWIDRDNGLWAVGGQTLSPPFTDGVLIHRGAPIATP